MDDNGGFKQNKFIFIQKEPDENDSIYSKQSSRYHHNSARDDAEKHLYRMSRGQRIFIIKKVV